MEKLRVKRLRYDAASLAPVVGSYASYSMPLRDAPTTSTMPSVSLTLRIPKHVPDAKERKELGARKAAAKRWVPKLQNPFPKDSEIKRAYSLKLMRHYPAAPVPATSQSVETPASAQTTLSTNSSISSSTSATSTLDATFEKPVIQKSDRVTKLLKKFPTMKVSRIAFNGITTQDLAHDQMVSDTIHANKRNTLSQHALRLAWKDFAEPDENPGREAMVESALPLEELMKEHRGIPNSLPEWKKYNTSKFVTEKRNHKGRDV